jgi:hypothetical protein
MDRSQEWISWLLEIRESAIRVQNFGEISAEFHEIR